MTSIMYDSVTVGTVPLDAPAAAGYTSGFWPTFLPLVARYPKLARVGRVKSIAIHANYDADFLDMESGDAALTDFPGWAERQLARGKKPGGYTSVSSWSELMGIANAHGIHADEIVKWSAHRTEHAHLCTDAACGFGFPGTANLTQWTWTALGRNLDESLCDDSVFAPPKPPAFNFHYDWYYDDPKLKERPVVEAYDKLRNQSLVSVLAHRKELGHLRTELRALANDVAKEAHDHPLKDGKPSYSEFHRGFRHLQMTFRADGQRIG